MTKKTPRPHQRAAVKAVVKGFKSHKRGKLIMACGTGKTLIAGWVREALKATCTLFMAPSNALLAQTLQAWREVSKKPFEALAVCSDVTVADGRDEDDLPAAAVGTAVTTDYQEISKFICGTGPRVVLCTYQSSEALALAMSLVKVPEFDLAIADEAHRTTGGADHLFPSITHPEKIRAAKRLFMTATPRFYFDNHVDEIVSMDNEELYGPTFFELDFAEAIRLKLLTDYEILIVGVSPEAEKGAEQLINENPRLKVGDRRMTARQLAVHIAILRTIKERKLERVITFHNSCPKASAAADFLPQLQEWMPKKYQTDVKLWARTVNHTMDIGDRHELMRQFVALKGPGVLTNARCLGEGVDVPTVDAIAFMDSKKSKIEIAQSVGRAIRLSPGKEKSYIILPVIMLPGDDAEQINSKSFKPAFDVINALRAHDSTLMDQLQHWDDKGSHGVGGRRGQGGGDEGRKITFDVPADCDPEIAEWFVCRSLERKSYGDWLLTMNRIKKHVAAKKCLTEEESAWLLTQKRRFKYLSSGSQEKVHPYLYLVGASRRTINRIAELPAMLNEAKKLGYRTHAMSVALKSLRVAYKNSSDESFKATVDELKRIPPQSSLLTANRLRLAAQLDAWVTEHGTRPSCQDKSLHPAYTWVNKARRNTKFLEGVRSKKWLKKFFQLPTFLSRTPARGRTLQADMETLTLLKAWVAKHRTLPRDPRNTGSPESHEAKLFRRVGNVLSLLYKGRMRTKPRVGIKTVYDKYKRVQR